MLSLDAALLHGLHALNKGYWPVVASLLDKDTLATVMSLPYATKPLTRGRDGGARVGQGEGMGLWLGCEAVGGVLSHQAAHER